MSKRPSTADHRPSVTESGEGDAFLSRWARRKRAARAGRDPEAQEPETPVDGEMFAKAAPTVGDEPLSGDDHQPVELTDEDMPAVDAIDENTDMSGFFSPKVTEAVKKAALRKFFHSPAFNIVDGLDDYDEDFRNFAALGDIITSDMRSQMEREAERARERQAGDAQAADESEDARAEDARAEAPASQEPPSAQVDETDASLQTADESRDGRVDEDSALPRSAAGESDAPGVTREPGGYANAGPGKLRPKGAAESNA